MAFQLGIAAGGFTSGLRSGWQMGRDMTGAFNEAFAARDANEEVDRARRQQETPLSDYAALAARTGIPEARLRETFPTFDGMSREDIQTGLNRLYGETQRPAAPAPTATEPVLQGGIPLRAPVVREDLPPITQGNIAPAVPGKPAAAPAVRDPYAGREGEPGTASMGKRHEAAYDATDLSGKPPSTTAPMAAAPGDALEGGIPAVPGTSGRNRPVAAGEETMRRSFGGLTDRILGGNARPGGGVDPMRSLGGNETPGLPLPGVDRGTGATPPPVQRATPDSVDKTKARTTAEQVEIDQNTAAAQRAGAGRPGGDKPPGDAPAPAAAPSAPGQPATPGQPRNFYDVQGIQEVGQNGQDTDRRNPRSSAMGPRQFIEGTWMEYARANPERFQGMSEQEILARRSSHEESLRASQWLAGRNAATLQQAGLPANDATVGVSAFVGGAGAVAVLRAAPGTTVEAALRQGGISERTVRLMTTAHPEFKTMTTDALMADYTRRYGTGTSYQGGPTQPGVERTTTTAQGQQTVAPPDAPPAMQNRWTVTMGRDGTLSLREGPSEPREYDIIRMRAMADGLARRGDARWADYAERANQMRTALRTEQSEEIQRGILRASVNGMDGLTRYLRDHHLLADGVSPRASTFRTADGTTMHRLSYAGMDIDGHTPGEVAMRISVMMGQNPQMVFRQLDHMAARTLDRDRFNEITRSNRVQEGQQDRRLNISERQTDAQIGFQQRSEERLNIAEGRQGRLADAQIGEIQQRTRRADQQADREEAVQGLQDELQQILRVPAYQRSQEQVDRAQQIATELGIRQPNTMRVIPNNNDPANPTTVNPFMQQAMQGVPTAAPTQGAADNTIQQLRTDSSDAAIAQARQTWQRNFRNGAALFDQMVLPRLQPQRNTGRGGQGLGAARPQAGAGIPPRPGSVVTPDKFAR